MTNDLIANPSNFYDNLCNQIILYSSQVSKELGISYSELWIGITGIIFLLFIWYNILLILAIYFQLEKITKWLFWISNISILLFMFFTFGDFLIFLKNFN